MPAVLLVLGPLATDAAAIAGIVIAAITVLRAIRMLREEVSGK